MDANVVARERALAVSGLVGRRQATRLDPKGMDGADVGRHAGFEEAYVAYRSAIYGYVRRMVGNDMDAEDLAVVTFEKALRAWDRRPPEGEMRPWLYRIATNACLDELRHRQKIQWQPWSAFISLFHPSQVAPDDPEEEAIRHEKVDLVRAALGKLSPRDRAALIMREGHGLSTEEIGSALGISREGAKVVLFRARERLRVVYLKLGGEPPDDGSADPRRPVSADGATGKRGGPRGARPPGQGDRDG